MTEIQHKRLSKTVLFARVSLFIVYFWFGFLKCLGVSPAEGLVVKLFDITLGHFMNAEVFLLTFGIFECLVGLAWLFPKLTKVAFWAMLFHMLATFLPMALLTNVTWEPTFLTLSLVGQYIVKNLVLIAVSLFVYFWPEEN